MTNPTLRTWTRTEMGGAVQWVADGAMVQLTSPAPHVWLVDLYEHGSRFGQEHGYTRGDAIQTAKRWVKALTKPAPQ